MRDNAAPVAPTRPPARAARPWVRRSRLLASLEHGVDAPIVLVSAAAGAGKSTLARQWLDEDPRVHLEVALATHMDDPAALCQALLDALEPAGAPAPDTRASIAGTEPTFSAVVLPALARLAASRTDEYVLVIDDLHVLKNRACHDVIQTVCDATPAGSQIMLLSREGAPSWLGRARAEGRLLEFTGDDLRLAADEAAELFHAMEVNPSRREVGEILEQTEGWAVGVYLTALAFQRQGEAPPAVAITGNRASHRYISDYITSQVLDPMKPSLRLFLTRTAVLEELNAELCNAVLGRDDSAAVLASLQQQLQLVIPLDPLGQHLRYHHLLGEALLTELEREAPAEVAELHRRTSRWYSTVGDLDAAIRHAKAAHDVPLVGQLVWSGIVGCIAAGRKDRLAAWLADLPGDQVALEPWLCLATAWLALQSGDGDRMDRWILCAEAHAGAGWRGSASEDPYAASLAVIVAIVGRGGLEESDQLCTAALKGLPLESQFRAPAAFVHGVVQTMRRSFDLGRQSLIEAERLARVLDVPIIHADALSWQGLLALAAGDHTNGARLIEAARDIIRANELERLATAAHCLTAQAVVLALRHDPAAPTALATARRLTTQIEQIAPWFAVCGRLTQAQAATALGDGALARQLITEAKARMTPDLEDSLAQDLLNNAEHSLSLLATEGMVASALTAAEIRVLQFLPSHLSYAQIGEHLFISSHTVKSHALAAYRKLGVSSRDQVVIRARELGLVEAPARD